MSRKKKIVLIVLAVVLAVLAGLVIWQRDNLKALVLSLRYSPEDLEARMSGEWQQVEDTIRESPHLTVRDLTEEEKEALHSSELSREELIEQMITPELPKPGRPAAEETPAEAETPDAEPEKKPAPEKPSAGPEPAPGKKPEPEKKPGPEEKPKPEKPAKAELPAEAETPGAESAPENKPAPEEPSARPEPAPEEKPEPEKKPEPEETPSREEADRKELNACIAELYVLREEYSELLAKMNQAAIDDFNDLPEEKQTTAAKYRIGSHYLGIAQEKEKECDAQIAQLERKIEKLLIGLGEDTALVGQIHEAYLNEKELKKAYYLGIH